MLNSTMNSPSLAQALVLAAGRGQRMRPLTDATPKPLLPVRGKPLMQWTLEALARAGWREVLLNLDWLGTQIVDYFDAHPVLASNGMSALSIRYSDEGADFGGALETAGGIARALPWLAPVFWVVAGDVYAPNFVFAPEALTCFARSGYLAHLWLVPNPAHNLHGDFGLSPDGMALNEPNEANQRFTFSTIALYRAELFAPPWCAIPAGNPHGIKAPMAPLLRAAIAAGRVSAQLYPGEWTDVGTPQRLAMLTP
jgi:MurNAc alpha-1-phosphate uridylyltransferase